MWDRRGLAIGPGLISLPGSWSENWGEGRQMWALVEPHVPPSAAGVGWGLGTSEPHCWIAEHVDRICCSLGGVLRVWWRGPLGCWSLGCGFSLHFLSLQEFTASLMRLLPSLGCLCRSQLQRVFKQHRVCIMAQWYISLWGFSLLLVLSGPPAVAGQWCHGCRVPDPACAGPQAFVVLPSVQSRGTIDSQDSDHSALCSNKYVFAIPSKHSWGWMPVPKAPHARGFCCNSIIGINYSSRVGKLGFLRM